MSRSTEYRDEFAEMALRLCQLGLTDAEMGVVFNVDQRTINRWKKRFPEFCQSVKKGKLVADAKVIEALYQKATGYQHLEEDMRVINGEVIKTQTMRHHPPDTTACIFWLKNRRGEHWQNKSQLPPEREVVIVHNALQVPGGIQQPAPTDED